MDKITLGQIATAVAFLGALISGIEFLAFRMRNYIKSTMKDEIEPLKEDRTRKGRSLSSILQSCFVRSSLYYSFFV